MLRTVHSKTQKAILVMESLSATHAFDYLVLSVNPGLTNCKDIAMVVENSLAIIILHT